MSPYKEYIIYIPKLNKWLQFLCFKKIFLKLIHKNGRIWWCKFRASSSSKNLIEYFLPKLKVVINENKFCHFYEHASRYLFVLPTIKCIFKSLLPLFGMLGYKPTTSAVTKIESRGIFLIF